MTAITAPFAARLESKTGRRLLLAHLRPSWPSLLYVLFQDQGTLPHDDAYPLFETLNGVRALGRGEPRLAGRLRAHPRGDRRPRRRSSMPSLAGLGWPGVLALAGALGLVFGGWRLALLSAGGFAALGLLGLWESTMATLAQMLAAVLISLLDRDPARDHRRPDAAVRGGDHADPRRHADHADLRLPRCR